MTPLIKREEARSKVYIFNNLLIETGGIGAEVGVIGVTNVSSDKMLHGNIIASDY